MKSFIIISTKFLEELLEKKVNNYFRCEILYDLDKKINLKTVAEKNKKKLFVFMFLLYGVKPKILKLHSGRINDVSFVNKNYNYDNISMSRKTDYENNWT